MDDKIIIKLKHLRQPKWAWYHISSLENATASFPTITKRFGVWLKFLFQRIWRWSDYVLWEINIFRFILYWRVIGLVWSWKWISFHSEYKKCRDSLVDDLLEYRYTKDRKPAFQNVSCYSWHSESCSLLTCWLRS